MTYVQMWHMTTMPPGFASGGIMNNWVLAVNGAVLVAEKTYSTEHYWEINAAVATAERSLSKQEGNPPC